eukprot:CAMPEP_0201152806 /NCGR_PEP_ID=MMETSP0851-20130426/13394_1 /ASSEMBLY_ACC=CAM_ASM_000631 /TAXON_ID=183588 /ORGANISM="Pseudo-nitzschia fraudulenta, Strain WWA7" /LENGTH=145 /DNA_ID=CAMNT_0047429905 /DNA_START=177 /DNA_END=614 /DNA_ORIENTATION=+
MTILADGMNLDGNTRCLLAAYDARTLDDFYLMSNADFRNLIQRAKATNHSLPPLQIRKVRMLRRWLKEIIDDNMSEEYEDDMHSEITDAFRRKRNKLVPKDWREQYKNDLPHLKIELRQQGDSVFERYPIFSVLTGMGCGTGGYY